MKRWRPKYHERWLLGRRIHLLWGDGLWTALFFGCYAKLDRTWRLVQVGDGKASLFVQWRPFVWWVRRDE